MDDGEVVLENDEQRDIDNDEAENMVVNHEEEWVKETLTEGSVSLFIIYMHFAPEIVIQ